MHRAVHPLLETGPVPAPGEQVVQRAREAVDPVHPGGLHDDRRADRPVPVRVQIGDRQQRCGHGGAV